MAGGVQKLGSVCLRVQGHGRGKYERACKHMGTGAWQGMGEKGSMFVRLRLSYDNQLFLMLQTTVPYYLCVPE